MKQSLAGPIGVLSVSSKVRVRTGERCRIVNEPDIAFAPNSYGCGTAGHSLEGAPPGRYAQISVGVDNREFVLGQPSEETHEWLAGTFLELGCRLLQSRALATLTGNDPLDVKRAAFRQSPPRRTYGIENKRLVPIKP